MNRGFKFYFREGLKYSSKTLKEKGNFLRFFLFMMVTAFSVLCPLLLPAVSMAYFRLARQVKYEQNIEVCKLFKACDNPKNYWTVILVDLMKGLLYIAMIFILVLLVCLSALLSGGIALLLNGVREFILLAIPAVILLVAFILIYPYSTVPTAFIVDNNDGINPTKALFDSVHALNKTGKRTYFATCLVEYLITMGILAVGIIVPSLPYLFMQDFFGLGLTIILFLVSMYFVIKLVVKFNLAFMVARYSLFEDLTTDKYKAGQRVEGVAVKGIESMTVQEKLEALFEEDANVQRLNNIINETEELSVVSCVKEEPVVGQPIDTPVLIVEEVVVEDKPVVEEQVTEEIKEEIEEPQEVTEEAVVEEESVFVEESTPEEVVEETEESQVTPQEQTPVEEPVVEEIVLVEESTPEEVEEEPIIEEGTSTNEEVEVISEEPVVEETAPVEESTPEEVEEESMVEEPVIEEVAEEPASVEEPTTKKRKSTKAVK